MKSTITMPNGTVHEVEDVGEYRVRRNADGAVTVRYPRPRHERTAEWKPTPRERRARSRGVLRRMRKRDRIAVRAERAARQKRTASDLKRAGEYRADGD